MSTRGGTSRNARSRIGAETGAVGGPGDVRSLAAHMHQQHPATDFDFGGMRLPQAQEAAQAFDELARAYPAAAARVAYLGTGQTSGASRFGQRVAAAINSGEGRTRLGVKTSVEGIGRTERYGIGLHGDLRGGALTDFHLNELAKSAPPGTNTIRGVVTHEFGHVLDSHLSNSERSGEHIAWKRTAVAEHGSPSAYAARQTDAYGRDQEAFADGFSSMRLTPQNQWSPYIRALADHLNAFAG